MNSSDEFSRKSLIGKTDLNTDWRPASSLARQTVHLQETLVRLLLDLDQVRDWNGRLDFRKVDALAVDVLGKAVHSLDLEEKGAQNRTGTRDSGRIPNPESQIPAVVT